MNAGVMLICSPETATVLPACFALIATSYKLPFTNLLLGEAVASSAVFVIVSESNGRASGWAETLWSQLNFSKTARDKPCVNGELKGTNGGLSNGTPHVPLTPKPEGRKVPFSKFSQPAAGGWRKRK